MKNKYNDSERQAFIQRYLDGERVQDICKDTDVPKSTFYSWIKPYMTVTTSTGVIVTPKAFDSLKRKAEKLENIVAILKTVECSVHAPLADRLNEIEKLYGKFTVHALCDALEVSRGTFYNHIKRNPRSSAWFVKRREELRVLIQEIYDESRQIYGAGKIRAVLTERGHIVSEKMVARIMREMGLYSIRTSAKKDYISLMATEKKTNKLQRKFHTDAPNQVWLSDITCFKLKDKYYYICVIIDLFSRKVISYKISTRNSTQLVTAVLKKAYSERTPSDTLILHSDRGVQYTSYAFQKLMVDFNIEQSLSKSGTPYDNAIAETFFASFKKEELYRTRYRSEQDFKKCIEQYMEFYNTRRPHASLYYKTPEQKEIEYVNEKNQ